ncbi:DUF1571 domain-containing protein [Roseiconus lacunae]|uniref:DUF1571 domain-containing protein n=1 Tax=Roseiconus lacunae TaxID=2605694 RepID=A0ABT7PHP1_9BACT|nr:DUF1571 domain-containing protein [Roseiconus lacunae]MCD0461186.1 DUF1571 domain-containing protein [Roseiconus lacunae]MDM4016012.1 DUF1571 domain-containing protein [Roseiconus lacunae]WRQ51656.1 DUF1571 domain-containing protein [Stieleria sp. HD01]
MQRRKFLALTGSLAATAAANQAFAKPPHLVEPVHRVANASITPAAPVKVSTLDTALSHARQSLDLCRENVTDYTALLVKRERIGDTLGPHEYMSAKIRCRKVNNGQLTQPLSVYLSFLKPSTVKGREVIYVEGQNNGNIIAHEGGFKGKFLPTVQLSPTGALAMRGQRYPMTEIGVENLLVKLIERGEQARQLPDVQADMRRGIKINNRPCMLLTVTQPSRRPDLMFYQAKVYMDEALKLPIRYVAYDWPKPGQSELEVLEEYNYLNLKVNVGLTDKDFDPNNSSYGFY